MNTDDRALADLIEREATARAIEGLQWAPGQAIEDAVAFIASAVRNDRVIPAADRLEAFHAKPDRDDIERDVRIAIWNAGMKGGMGQDLSQAFIVRAMAEPTMVRALAALQSPPPVVEEGRREAATIGLCSDCPPDGYPTDKTRCDLCPRRGAPAILALTPVEGVGMRYSASGDNVVDADERNTFQVVPVNRTDGDSLAIGVAEAMNAALSAPVAAQGDEVREALEWLAGQPQLELFHYSPVYGDDDDQDIEWRVTKVSGPINDREWDIVGRGETPIAAILNARAALATLGAPHEG